MTRFFEHSMHASCSNHSRRLHINVAHAYFFLLAVIIACHLLVCRLEGQHLLRQQSVIPVAHLHDDMSAISTVSSKSNTSCGLVSFRTRGFSNRQFDLKHDLRKGQLAEMLTTRASSFTIMRPFLAVMASPQAAQASLSTSMPFVFSSVCNNWRHKTSVLSPHRIQQAVMCQKHTQLGEALLLLVLSGMARPL